MLSRYETTQLIGKQNVIHKFSCKLYLRKGVYTYKPTIHTDSARVVCDFCNEYVNVSTTYFNITRVAEGVNKNPCPCRC